jgi:hypothetical protein
MGANAACLASRCVNRQHRVPIARSEGDFLLPKPFKRATLASKSLANFGCLCSPRCRSRRNISPILA